MKTFITQIAAFTAVVLVSFGAILGLADGRTDAFYARFTTPLQSNLILGTSRAAQGLQPGVFKEVLGIDMFNYAFTIAASPYGPTYLESLQRKLRPGCRECVHVLAVDPWSVSSRIEDPEDQDRFRERESFLFGQEDVSSSPNFSYLLRNLKGQFYVIPFRLLVGGPLFLHDDGWLEVTVGMSESAVRSRRAKKVAEYRHKNLPIYQPSSARLEALIETIEFLQGGGEVYLVRLPIHPDLMAIEDELDPLFNATIEEAIERSSGYLDLTARNDEFNYTDGNHLHKDSGAEVSAEIARWLQSHQERRAHDGANPTPRTYD